MRLLTCDSFSNKSSFFFSLMSKHRPAYHISNSVNILYVGLHMLIYRDHSAFANLYACSISFKSAGESFPSYRDKTVIGLKFYFVTFFIIGLHYYFISFSFYCLYFMAQVKFHSLLL